MKKCSKVIVLLVLTIQLLSCKTSENNATIAESNNKIASDSLKAALIEYQPAQSKTFDLIHTRLDIQPNWSEKSIKGVAELTMRPYFYPAEFIVLDAKNFEISEISIFKKGTNRSLKYENTGLNLLIELDQQYNRTDTISILIHYKAFPYRNNTARSSSISSSRGLFFIDPDSTKQFTPTQIWTQGETEYNSNWFPTFDQPNVRTTQDLSITVNDKFKTLSNGLMVSSINNGNGTRTDRWVLNKPHPPYLFMLAIGDYAVVDDNSEDLEISYWVEPAYKKYAKEIFGSTPEMIEFYEELLGVDFPWPKYDQVVVRDYVSGAMENTTASVFMEELQMTSKELIDSNWEGIISHELFHQWFGNLVTCESWANLPLNEAFASYGEQLWIEYKYGREEAAFHAINELDDYLEESETKQVDLIRYYYESEEDMFDSHSYAKGSRIFNMLRYYLGDEAFFAGLKYYLEKNANKSVEVHDLRLALEFVSGEDLNWFFNQWFLEAGHPELYVEHRVKEDTLYVDVEQLQDLDISPLYQLPVFLDLIYENAIYRYPVTVENQSHNFKVPIEKSPKAVIFDGDYQIVGIVDHLKSGEELLNQLKYGDSFHHRYESVIKIVGDTASSQWDEVFSLALNDSSKHIRQIALELALNVSINKLDPHRENIFNLSTDNNSQVRAAALQLLFYFDTDENLWLRAVNDSSILVQSVALEYLFSKNIKEDSLFYEYEKSRYVGIQLPVAYKINQDQKAGYFKWYMQNILRAHSTDRYYLIQMLNEYLLVLDESEKNEAVKFLFDMAMDDSYYLNRFAAAQGLMSLSEISGVNEKMREIMDSEQDIRLLEIYNSR